MKQFIITALLFVIITNSNAQVFTNYTTSNGLPDNYVTGIAIDSLNNKWFATQSGVAKFNDTIWKTYTTTDGLLSNAINCIYVDNQNSVWVGTDLGISVYDGNTWKSFTKTDGLVNNIVNTISQDLKGAIWIGTNGGISKYVNNIWTNYTTTEGLSSNMISCISVDLSDNKWIGTWIGGLIKYNDTSFTIFNTDNSSLLDNNVISIAIDSNNNKWIGTFYGVSVFDATNQWKLNYEKDDGLYNNYVQDIDIDGKGNIWFGIYADYLQEGGITRFDGTSWNSYTISNGLVNRMVKRIKADKNNKLWIATGNGVSMLSDVSVSVETLQAESDNGCKVFPNPTNGFVYVNCKNNTEPIIVKITDLMGHSVFQSDGLSNGSRLNIETVVMGTYIVQVFQDNKAYRYKLSVK
ncbi:MAG: hypothetical protein A2X12_09000 [Bacteroidetes bacterium GWE2_29_8]|nr:MAG: hypothetical protein A2X12_09000 [Bacteroidetes bacterium GWE2_29_8]OFY18506.1 MAG: hypothetical protein A2X02_07795 [Bacteroidetes bacterium GWF2_29_10]